MIKKYVKKPIEIEALQYTGENLGECIEFMENNFDITKIYTETENKKKIGISSIFSIFIGKGKDKKKVENIS